jgi:hypothetical protein
VRVGNNTFIITDFSNLLGFEFAHLTPYNPYTNKPANNNSGNLRILTSLLIAI